MIESQEKLYVVAFVLTAGVCLWALVSLTIMAPPALGAHNARMDVTPAVVEPGGEIEVEGLWAFAPGEVRLHWGGLNGDVIATFESGGSFGPATVTIPDAEPGTYVLVANQDVPDDHLWGKNIPARAQVQVAGDRDADVGDDSQTATSEPDVRRLASLQEQQAPNTLALVGIALAVAVATWLLAGIVSRTVR